MSERICTIEGCGSKAACRGWCWKHYDRWRKHGDPMKLGPRGERGTIIADPLERFWSKVEKTEGCWVWTGKTQGRSGSAGYASIVMNGKAVLAHRWSYEQARGPIPTGLVIDHLCRETRCVNPDHLEAVTVQENSRRAGASRAIPTLCGYGHDMLTSARSRKDGSRYCGTCANETQSARRAKRRTVTAASVWLDDNPTAPGAEHVRALLRVL